MAALRLGCLLEGPCLEEMGLSHPAMVASAPTIFPAAAGQAVAADPMALTGSQPEILREASRQNPASSPDA
jgi:hypothetical protein